MKEIPEITVHNLRTKEEIQQHYKMLVEELIKINAVIDLMRVGVNLYTKKFPDDHQMTYGAVASLRYMSSKFMNQLAQVGKWRVIAGNQELSNDPETAMQEIFKEQFGVSYPGRGPFS